MLQGMIPLGKQNAEIVTHKRRGKARNSANTLYWKFRIKANGGMMEKNVFSRVYQKNPWISQKKKILEDY